MPDWQPMPQPLFRSHQVAHLERVSRLLAASQSPSVCLSSAVCTVQRLWGEWKCGGEVIQWAGGEGCCGHVLPCDGMCDAAHVALRQQGRAQEGMKEPELAVQAWACWEVRTSSQLRQNMQDR